MASGVETAGVILPRLETIEIRLAAVAKHCNAKPGNAVEQFARVLTL